MNWKKIKTDCLVYIAKQFVKLPLSWIDVTGRSLGYMAYLIPNKRKKVAARNIQLCFPELSSTEQTRLLKRNLISTGQGLMESLVAYWGSDKKCLRKYEIRGLEHIEKALQGNMGCLLLSCHHHLLDHASRVINLSISTSAHLLVRQHNNKVFESHVDAARRSYCEKTIDKKDMRNVLKSLKGNHPVLYVPDQNFSYQFEYIDFFNQPAATVIAPSRIAQSTKTPVIPWFAFRLSKNKYLLEFSEPLNYFADSDTRQTLKKMNQLIEDKIRQHPEQYLWVHRRFKNHPEGKNHLYRNL